MTVNLHLGNGTTPISLPQALFEVTYSSSTAGTSYVDVESEFYQKLLYIRAQTERYWSNKIAGTGYDDGSDGRDFTENMTQALSDLLSMAKTGVDSSGNRLSTEQVATLNALIDSLSTYNSQFSVSFTGDTPVLNGLDHTVEPYNQSNPDTVDASWDNWIQKFVYGDGTSTFLTATPSSPVSFNARIGDLSLSHSDLFDSTYPANIDSITLGNISLDVEVSDTDNPAFASSQALKDALINALQSYNAGGLQQADFDALNDAVGAYIGQAIRGELSASQLNALNQLTSGLTAFANSSWDIAESQGDRLSGVSDAQWTSWFSAILADSSSINGIYPSFSLQSEQSEGDGNFETFDAPSIVLAPIPSIDLFSKVSLQLDFGAGSTTNIQAYQYASTAASISLFNGLLTDMASLYTQWKNTSNQTVQEGYEDQFATDIGQMITLANTGQLSQSQVAQLQNILTSLYNSSTSTRAGLGLSPGPALAVDGSGKLTNVNFSFNGGFIDVFHDVVFSLNTLLPYFAALNTTTHVYDPLLPSTQALQLGNISLGVDYVDLIATDDSNNYNYLVNDIRNILEGVAASAYAIPPVSYTVDSAQLNQDIGKLIALAGLGRLDATRLTGLNTLLSSLSTVTNSAVPPTTWGVDSNNVLTGVTQAQWNLWVANVLQNFGSDLAPLYPENFLQAFQGISGTTEISIGGRSTVVPYSDVQTPTISNLYNKYVTALQMAIQKISAGLSLSDLPSLQKEFNTALVQLNQLLTEGDGEGHALSQSSIANLNSLLDSLNTEIPGWSISASGNFVDQDNLDISSPTFLTELEAWANTVIGNPDALSNVFPAGFLTSSQFSSTTQTSISIGVNNINIQVMQPVATSDAVQTAYDNLVSDLRTQINNWITNVQAPLGPNSVTATTIETAVRNDLSQLVDLAANGVDGYYLTAEQADDLGELFHSVTSGTVTEQHQNFLLTPVPDVTDLSNQDVALWLSFDVFHSDAFSEITEYLATADLIRNTNPDWNFLPPVPFAPLAETQDIDLGDITLAWPVSSSGTTPEAYTTAVNNIVGVLVDIADAYITNGSPNYYALTDNQRDQLNQNLSTLIGLGEQGLLTGDDISAVTGLFSTISTNANGLWSLNSNGQLTTTGQDGALFTSVSTAQLQGWMQNVMQTAGNSISGLFGGEDTLLGLTLAANGRVPGVALSIGGNDVSVPVQSLQINALTEFFNNLIYGTPTDPNNSSIVPGGLQEVLQQFTALQAFFPGASLDSSQYNSIRQALSQLVHTAEYGYQGDNIDYFSQADLSALQKLTETLSAAIPNWSIDSSGSLFEGNAPLSVNAINTWLAAVNGHTTADTGDANNLSVLFPVGFQSDAVIFNQLLAQFSGVAVTQSNNSWTSHPVGSAFDTYVNTIVNEANAWIQGGGSSNPDTSAIVVNLNDAVGHLLALGRDGISGFYLTPDQASKLKDLAQSLYLFSGTQLGVNGSSELTGVSEAAWTSWLANYASVAAINSGNQAGALSFLTENASDTNVLQIGNTQIDVTTTNLGLPTGYVDATSTISDVLTAAAAQTIANGITGHGSYILSQAQIDSLNQSFGQLLYFAQTGQLTQAALTNLNSLFSAVAAYTPSTTWAQNDTTHVLSGVDGAAWNNWFQAVYNNPSIVSAYYAPGVVQPDVLPVGSGYEIVSASAGPNPAAYDTALDDILNVLQQSRAGLYNNGSYALTSAQLTRLRSDLGSILTLAQQGQLTAGALGEISGLFTILSNQSYRAWTVDGSNSVTAASISDADLNAWFQSVAANPAQLNALYSAGYLSSATLAALGLIPTSTIDIGGVSTVIPVNPPNLPVSAQATSVFEAFQNSLTAIIQQASLGSPQPTNFLAWALNKQVTTIVNLLINGDGNGHFLNQAEIDKCNLLLQSLNQALPGWTINTDTIGGTIVDFNGRGILTQALQAELQSWAESLASNPGALAGLVSANATTPEGIQNTIADMIPAEYQTSLATDSTIEQLLYGVPVPADLHNILFTADGTMFTTEFIFRNGSISSATFPNAVPYERAYNRGNTDDLIAQFRSGLTKLLNAAQNGDGKGYYLTQEQKDATMSLVTSLYAISGKQIGLDANGDLTGLDDFDIVNWLYATGGVGLIPGSGGIYVGQAIPGATFGDLNDIFDPEIPASVSHPLQIGDVSLNFPPSSGADDPAYATAIDSLHTLLINSAVQYFQNGGSYQLSGTQVTQLRQIVGKLWDLGENSQLSAATLNLLPGLFSSLSSAMNTRWAKDTNDVITSASVSSTQWQSWFNSLMGNVGRNATALAPLFTANMLTPFGLAASGNLPSVTMDIGGIPTATPVSTTMTTNVQNAYNTAISGVGLILQEYAAGAPYPFTPEVYDGLRGYLGQLLNLAENGDGNGHFLSAAAAANLNQMFTALSGTPTSGWGIDYSSGRLTGVIDQQLQTWIASSVGNIGSLNQLYPANYLSTASIGAALVQANVDVFHIGGFTDVVPVSSSMISAVSTAYNTAVSNVQLVFQEVAAGASVGPLANTLNQYVGQLVNLAQNGDGNGNHLSAAAVDKLNLLTTLLSGIVQNWTGDTVSNGTGISTANWQSLFTAIAGDPDSLSPLFPIGFLSPAAINAALNQNSVSIADFGGVSAVVHTSAAMTQGVSNSYTTAVNDLQLALQELKSGATFTDDFATRFNQDVGQLALLAKNGDGNGNYLSATAMSNLNHLLTSLSSVVQGWTPETVASGAGISTQNWNDWQASALAAPGAFDPLFPAGFLSTASVNQALINAHVGLADIGGVQTVVSVSDTANAALVTNYTNAIDALQQAIQIYYLLQPNSAAAQQVQQLNQSLSQLAGIAVNGDGNGNYLDRTRLNNLNILLASVSSVASGWTPATVNNGTGITSGQWNTWLSGVVSNPNSVVPPLDADFLSAYTINTLLYNEGIGVINVGGTNAIVHTSTAMASTVTNYFGGLFNEILDVLMTYKSQGTAATLSTLQLGQLNTAVGNLVNLATNGDGQGNYLDAQSVKTLEKLLNSVNGTKTGWSAASLLNGTGFTSGDWTNWVNGIMANPASLSVYPSIFLAGPFVTLNFPGFVEAIPATGSTASDPVNQLYQSSVATIQSILNSSSQTIALTSDQINSLSQAIGKLVYIAQFGVNGSPVTVNMAKNIDLLINSLEAVGVPLSGFPMIVTNPPNYAMTGVSDSSWQAWRDLALSSNLLQPLLGNVTPAQFQRSIQAMVELNYVRTGNEMLAEQLSSLQSALSTTQTVLDSLTSLQNLHNLIQIPSGNFSEFFHPSAGLTGQAYFDAYNTAASAYFGQPISPNVLGGAPVPTTDPITLGDNAYAVPASGIYHDWTNSVMTAGEVAAALGYTVASGASPDQRVFSESDGQVQIGGALRDDTGPDDLQANLIFVKNGETLSSDFIERYGFVSMGDGWEIQKADGSYVQMQAYYQPINVTSTALNQRLINESVAVVTLENAETALTSQVTGFNGLPATAAPMVMDRVSGNVTIASQTINAALAQVLQLQSLKSGKSYLSVNTDIGKIYQNDFATVEQLKKAQTTLFTLIGTLSAQLAKLNSATAAADPNSLYSKVLAVYNDLTSSFEGMTKDTPFINVFSALSTWLLDGYTNSQTTQGTFQKNITFAITASESLNSTQQQQVSNYLFIFQEFQKSAAAILQQLTQIIQNIAQNIAR